MIKTGKLDAGVNKSISGLQRARELADDDASIIFDANSAADATSEAAHFLETAERLTSTLLGSG